MKLGLERLLEADGLGGDDVDERAALLAGEDRLVDGGAVLGLGEDHAGARTAQGFVGGGGDDVGVRHGRGMHASGDQSGEVRHVHQVDGADFVGDLAHAGEVEWCGDRPSLRR